VQRGLVHFEMWLLIRVFRGIEASDSFSISLEGVDALETSQSALLAALPTFESLAAGF